MDIVPEDVFAKQIVEACVADGIAAKCLLSKVGCFMIHEHMQHMPSACGMLPPRPKPASLGIASW
jgi:hypothetical protein